MFLHSLKNDFELCRFFYFLIVIDLTVLYNSLVHSFAYKQEIITVLSSQVQRYNHKLCLIFYEI